MRRRIRGMILILAGLFCLCLAASMLLKNRLAEEQADIAVAAVVPALEQRIRVSAEDTGTIDGAEDGPEESAADPVEPAIEIDGRFYIGMIDIPSLELKVPVMGELTDANLKSAPCLYSGSLEADSMIVAGHNYQRHFSRLKQLALGDTLSFIRADGETRQFYVSAMEVIGGNDVAGMQSGDWDLTLFTCTYGGSNRLAVRCETAPVRSDGTQLSQLN